jgi:hypothetical protein
MNNFIKNPDLTARKAGSLLKAELQRRKLSFQKVSSRTISFAGFGYGSSIFVDVYGWVTNPTAWRELLEFAHKNGFHLEVASYADGSPVFSCSPS